MRPASRCPSTTSCVQARRGILPSPGEGAKDDLPDHRTAIQLAGSMASRRAGLSRRATPLACNNRTSCPDHDLPWETDYGRVAARHRYLPLYRYRGIDAAVGTRSFGDGRCRRRATWPCSTRRSPPTTGSISRPSVILCRPPSPPPRTRLRRPCRLSKRCSARTGTSQIPCVSVWRCTLEKRFRTTAVTTSPPRSIVWLDYWLSATVDRFSSPRRSNS